MSKERIEELLRLMEAHGLAELELKDGDFSVRLSKGAMLAAAAPFVAAGLSPAPAAPVAGAPAAKASAAGADLRQVKSPIVGTFYSAPAPDASPFVRIGDEVNEETVVCIVEAMKVMNEVKAEKSGVIKEILVENASPVEYGQPLFVIE